MVFPWIFVLTSVSEVGCVYTFSSLALTINQVVFKAPSVLTPVPRQSVLVDCGSHCAEAQAWVGGTPVEVQMCVPLEVREDVVRRAWALSFLSVSKSMVLWVSFVVTPLET